MIFVTSPVLIIAVALTVLPLFLIKGFKPFPRDRKIPPDSIIIIYCLQSTFISPSAPRKSKSGERNVNIRSGMEIPIIISNKTPIPQTLSASFSLPSPLYIDIRTALPTPIPTATELRTHWRGHTILIAPRAALPVKFPINSPSIIE